MQNAPHVSLKPYNTFGIDVKAAKFSSARTAEELKRLLAQKESLPLFILSGGSNILLTQDLQAHVIHINLQGKEVLEEREDKVIIRVMAGENWHQLVLWTLKEGYGGIENLALIPGKTGTAPIQNIGAYGVELKDVFQGCQAMEISSGEVRYFDREACQFGYRDSVFKNELKGKYIIISVDLALSLKNHQLRTAYGDIESELQGVPADSLTPEQVANAVIAIRRRKLPDPAKLGNSGSFFKNPVISAAQYATLKEKYSDLPGYSQPDDLIKVPAGWLIEKCGFKGVRRGDAGVHSRQALVLVNYGNASGSEILGLAREIQQKVREDYGIDLVPEVNIL
ncbi:UDP-N-acetylmuramate dehydrogenase [Robiginitalea sp. IMCC44478]|uniref:UDP-N-acetylmuramate dehydrogenase n=1 Tax=Robiginitalea sp. IMCC44478 TaxID=3459122 RepID=UPI00404166F3